MVGVQWLLTPPGVCDAVVSVKGAGLGSWISDVLKADGASGERATGTIIFTQYRVWRSSLNLMVGIVGNYMSSTSSLTLTHQVCR